MVDSFVDSWKGEQSEFKHGSRALGKLPKVVFVQIIDDNGEDLPWTLPGLKEPGLYQII